MAVEWQACGALPVLAADSGADKCTQTPRRVNEKVHEKRIAMHELVQGGN